MAEVEKSTRQLNDTHDDHTIRMDNLKAELACIHDKMKRQTENFNKKIDEQKRQINETANCVKEESQKFNEDAIDMKLNNMRDTLIFYNIPEVDGENCKDILLQFCECNLKMDDAPNKIKIEQANIMGKQGPRN